jgi:UDP-3-O-[3-hydroxymyristoyl] glucosamine N-acyltransferase
MCSGEGLGRGPVAVGRRVGVALSAGGGRAVSVGGRVGVLSEVEVEAGARVALAAGSGLLSRPTAEQASPRIPTRLNSQKDRFFITA